MDYLEVRSASLSVVFLWGRGGKGSGEGKCVVSHLDPHKTKGIKQTERRTNLLLERR